MDVSSKEKISIQSAERWVPGNPGRRLLAVMLDGLIVGIASFPIGMGIALYGLSKAPDSILFNNILPLIVRLVIMYFYFGYFYSTKGASPGKMVLGLRVINSETGKNLSYWRAFFRETIGKFVSTLPLFIGYLMAYFRADKKALHDVLFDTQVLYQSEEK